VYKPLEFRLEVAMSDRSALRQRLNTRPLNLVERVAPEAMLAEPPHARAARPGSESRKQG
jgi:hypothetical protein